MRLAKRSTMLLALAAALLAPTGCGGGGEGTTTLTKAQFLKQAIAICVKYNAKMSYDVAAYLDKHAGKHRSEAEEDEAAGAVIPPFREKEVRLIRGLGLPSGEEDYVDEMLTAWEEGVKKGEEDPHSLRMTYVGPTDQTPGFAFLKSYRMGIRYGLEKCWLS